jgi:hypothetical protein
MIKTRLPLFVRPYIHASSIVILVLVLLAGQVWQAPKGTARRRGRLRTGMLTAGRPHGREMQGQSKR